MWLFLFLAPLPESFIFLFLRHFRHSQSERGEEDGIHSNRLAGTTTLLASLREERKREEMKEGRKEGHMKGGKEERAEERQKKKGMRRGGE